MADELLASPPVRMPTAMLKLVAADSAVAVGRSSTSLEIAFDDCVLLTPAQTRLSTVIISHKTRNYSLTVLRLAP